MNTPRKITETDLDARVTAAFHPDQSPAATPLGDLLWNETSPWRHDRTPRPDVVAELARIRVEESRLIDQVRDIHAAATGRPLTEATAYAHTFGERIKGSVIDRGGSAADYLADLAAAVTSEQTTRWVRRDRWEAK